MVKVNRDGFIGLAIQVYFATCLFSLYFQLKNKEEVQKRDAEAAELTFVKKNTGPISTFRLSSSSVLYLQCVFTCPSHDQIND